MKKLILFTLLGLLCHPLMAQDIENLEEIVIRVANYKYLNAIDNSEAPEEVKILQREAANYDISDRDLYVDEYHTYNVSFRIPEGKMVVAYDADGKIIKTIEKFNNIRIPLAIRNALSEKYSDWQVVKDLYVVHYTDTYGAEKVYEIKLKKDSKTLKVKLDERGNYID